MQDLQPHQIHTFYEAVGLMIGAEGDTAKRDAYLVRMHRTWASSHSDFVESLRSRPDCKFGIGLGHAPIGGS